MTSTPYQTHKPIHNRWIERVCKWAPVACLWTTLILMAVGLLNLAMPGLTATPWLNPALLVAASILPLAAFYTVTVGFIVSARLARRFAIFLIYGSIVWIPVFAGASDVAVIACICGAFIVASLDIVGLLALWADEPMLTPMGTTEGGWYSAAETVLCVLVVAPLMMCFLAPVVVLLTFIGMEMGASNEASIALGWGVIALIPAVLSNPSDDTAAHRAKVKPFLAVVADYGQAVEVYAIEYRWYDDALAHVALPNSDARKVQANRLTFPTIQDAPELIAFEAARQAIQDQIRAEQEATEAVIEAARQERAAWRKINQG